jgi:hypothetical protein
LTRFRVALEAVFGPYPGQVVASAQIPILQNNDTLGVALDERNHRVWFNINGKSAVTGCAGDANAAFALPVLIAEQLDGGPPPRRYWTVGFTQPSGSARVALRLGGTRYPIPKGFFGYFPSTFCPAPP